MYLNLKLIFKELKVLIKEVEGYIFYKKATIRLFLVKTHYIIYNNTQEKRNTDDQNKSRLLGVETYF